MKIAYSPDADVLTIQLREGKPADSRDVAEGVIAHLSAKGQLLSEFNEDNGDCGFEERGVIPFSRRIMRRLRK